MKARPGINIQHPISRMIHDGSKTVETRTYPLPKKYIGKELYLVETPGVSGTFLARVIGVVVFGESFLYPSKEAFRADYKRHSVDEASPYRWDKHKKWGWPVVSYKPLPRARPAPKRRGIRFTQSIQL